MSGKSYNQNENRSQTIDQISGKRLWLFRFIAIVVMPTLFFLLFEMTLRLFHFGYPTTALIEYSTNDEKYLCENPAFAYRFFSKKLAREFVPLRFKADKADDVFRVFILGGSAARGTPDPAYSFGRILDVMLHLRYPDTQFEILSLAMPAINSHVVLEIAEECAEYDPDLFVVYLGNNEVIGPYGAGTVLTPIISNNLLLRLAIKLKTTKISQLMILGLEKLSIQKSPYTKWKGMEMFLENQVQLNDPSLEITYKNFNDNLERLNQISQNNDIKVIYSTVVSNLKDCPPFNSVHRTDINLSDRQLWDELYASGSALEKDGEFNAAITKYLEAAKIDSQYADLHFRLGRCYWHTGDFAKAGASYKRAMEYDANRFRADNRINNIIHHAARAKPGITFLSDVLQEIEQKSPHGVPGNEFLLEHVHLNFKGNYQVARAILYQIEHIFSDDLKDQRIDETVQLSDSLCAAHLVYNKAEHHRILDLVLNKFIKQPPFTNQLYHVETIKYLEDALDSLQHIIRGQDSNHTINAYENAIRKRPADWWLHFKFAEYLADNNVGDYGKAADHFQFVINTIPHNASAYVTRASVLAKLGRFDEALAHNQKALSINPTIAKAYFNSGLIYQKKEKLELAVENYQKAVFYLSTHTKAYNNMAFICSQRGNTSKAIATIDDGLIANPEDLLLNYNKAMILYKNGRKAEAIEQLRHVIKLAPNEVKIQEKLNEWLSKEN